MEEMTAVNGTGPSWMSVWVLESLRIENDRFGLGNKSMNQEVISSVNEEG